MVIFITGTPAGSAQTSTGYLGDNQWHHVAFTVETNIIRSYWDGYSGYSFGWSGTPGTPAVNAPLRIGTLSPQHQHFSGALDEISLWNTALSLTQIQSYKNRSLTGSETNLVSYWRFDEAAGTSAFDSSPLQNAATLTNNPTWITSTVPLTNGSPGTALQFNGVNQEVTVDRWAPSALFFRARGL
ncbi:MAG: hypothetical protein QM813_22580 [Verrucomicrobiota bacterium]